ncbi:Mbeg1-like protein [Merdibacter massiliensis]|uniref:Mbeg1-like protein n=1 Tax=Merdibacter massiliensis TaxID=1871030 RepID=UPI00096AA3A3|nr:Mbeg1-like protein [Merdibacter massiliensis]
MLDILDYITLRKDLSFTQCAFQEIDALIFCELAYVEWTGIVEKPILLSEACSRFFQEYAGTDFTTKYAYSVRIPQLVHALQKTSRYQHIELLNYQSVFDETQEIQFAAITLRLEDGALFIAYRGTDNSILGWKEDMKMTYLDEIPSHLLAWNYASEMYERYRSHKRTLISWQKKHTPLYLGGHSKGGNLAMYVAIREQQLHPWLRKVYNFDGPGFRPSFYEHYDAAPVLDKIVTIVPKETIIGRLLLHKERYTVIDAQGNGLSQHDGFHWSVDAYGFVRVDHWSEESDRIQQMIDEMLMSKEDAQRKEYIDLIFHILDRLEIRQISDFSSMSIRQGMTGIRELSTLNNNERKFLFDVINFLWTQTKSVLFHPVNEKQ